MKENEKKLVSIEDLKRDYVAGKLKEGMYSSTNELGEDVTVMIGRDGGFDVHTNQNNGWVRIDYYDYDKEEDLWTQGETYNGKWE